MARLRHTASGAIVSVPDEKVAGLGSEWESADKPKPAKKAAAKKSAAKKSK